MKAKSAIRLTWIPGILFLGLSGWLFLREPALSPSPGLTREAANQLAAPWIQTTRRQMSLLAPPSKPLGPAIRLRTGIIPPANLPTDPVAPIHGRPSVRGYPWMVLFEGPIQSEWRTSLESAGAVVCSYLPDHALLIEAPQVMLAQLSRWPHVVWSGEYLPVHKVQPLLAAMAKQKPDLLLPVTIQTFSPDDTAGLVRQLTASGIADIQATPAKRWGLVSAVLSAHAAAELALLPEVEWVEHHATPKMLNDLSMADDRLNIISAYNDHGLDGRNQIVAIADTGLDTGDTNTLHPDFAGRLIHVFDTGRLTNWSDTYYHGTHVAGSLLGSGAASDTQFRGAAPAAQLVFQSIMTATETLALPDDLNEFFQPPYGLGARVHSDSWGSSVAGEYTTDSMATDEFIWDHPDLLVAFAAGNSGTDADRNGVVDNSSLDAPGSAKNVLTVGASESGRISGSGGMTARTYGSAWGTDYRVPPLSTDLISSSPAGEPQGIVAFSGRGPTADGRTKPDIVAPGTDIVSVRSRASTDTGWGVLAANTNYCFMGGTSMATPLAAGAATLIRQYCTDTLGLESPSAALLKAALVGGARSLSPGQYGTNAYREIPERPRPNTVEGWGQADIAGTLFPSNGIESVLMEGASALHTGGSNTLVFAVHSNAPLTVAMAYSDYPSALSAAVNLVNDLDLLLLDPSGTPHFPNGLEKADDLNNVEGMDVAAAATGRWTLVISARNVPQGPQPYALYLRGSVYMPISIAHSPLENTWETEFDYEVVADVTSVGEFDPGTVRLFWIATGSTSGFASATMTTTNGTRFEARIPAQPVGSRIWYFLSAGPPELPAYHPIGAPVAVNTFDIVPPLSLTVSGAPANIFAADPAYGTNTFPSNAAFRASVSYPFNGTNGWRTACIGWQGTGSVPATGELNFCDLTLTENSSLTWQWQEQVALMHTSSPYGAIGGNTWHAKNATASSLIAPESHTFNRVPLTFAGWTVDGVRWPGSNVPSPQQLDVIPMPTPRTARAIYVPTAQDSDENLLPDWFELRHFGTLGQDRYADPDGDHYENELEAADHTDPFDPLSIPTSPVIQHTPLDSPAATPAPWTVVAIITDNYRVASATLHWQRNGGLARSSAMTNEPGSTERFMAQIPSPARDGDVILYSIAAADDAGFLTQSESWSVTVSYPRLAFSPTALEVSAPAATQTNATLLIQNQGGQPLYISLEIAPVGFADDMESGTNGWTRPDGNTDWHLSSQNAYSSSNAWYCGLEDSRVYRNSTHAVLVSPSIQLAAFSPRLDFMHRARFERDSDAIPDGAHYWDSGVLEISDNNGLTWQALVPEGGYPGLITSNFVSPFAPDTPCLVDTLDWDPVGAELSAYTNRAVKIRFRFGADQYTVAEGWRIDDFRVSPRTEYADWLTLPTTNFSLEAGLSTNLMLEFDTATLPPMASGYLSIRIHHNDPEQSSPIVVSIALHNISRRVRITTEGDGLASPDDESLVSPDQPFTVILSANTGSFIADIRTNGILSPLPEVISTQILHWVSLASNLDLQAVFAPQLEEGSVPPEWLAQFGLTSRNWMAESSLDQDGDGFLTWQEQALDSNPTNPADAQLRVNFVPQPEGSNDWRITWHAFTNRSTTYSVLSSSNLTDGFVSFTNLVASPPLMTSPPLPANQRFFGIRSP